MDQSVNLSANPAQQTSEPSQSASPSTPEPAGFALAERLTSPKQHESSSTGASTVSDLQAMYESKASEIQEGAWAADFARAMAAVDQTDVLAEESPFTHVKRQVCSIYDEQHNTSHIAQTALPAVTSLSFVIVFKGLFCFHLWTEAARGGRGGRTNA